MRLRSRFWSSWCRALVLVVLLGLGVAPLGLTSARADGSDRPPAKNERVVEIGPQAVIIVNERGEARMYDDPSQQVRGCTSTAACLGKVLAAFVPLSIVMYGNARSFVGDRAQGTSVSAPPE